MVMAYIAMAYTLGEVPRYGSYRHRGRSDFTGPCSVRVWGQHHGVTSVLLEASTPYYDTCYGHMYGIRKSRESDVCTAANGPLQ